MSDREWGRKQIEKFREFNCRFCKNTSTCDLYPFICDPDTIRKFAFEIPDGSYTCPGRGAKRGMKIARVEPGQGGIGR